MISAPVAPIAPPSVGVAMPRKMVPSTRKISTRGGSSTKTTRSESCDSSPRRSHRLASASASAKKAATVIDRVRTSSIGALPSRPISGLMMLSCRAAQAKAATTERTRITTRERCPLAPFASL